MARRLPIELIQATNLESIRLQRVDAESRIRGAAELSKPMLQVGYSAKVRERLKNGVFVIVSAEAVVRDQALEAPESAVRIAVDFELHYVHAVELDPSEEELGAFAQVNAVFNAWPYLREVLQSTSVRMGLPPVLLPLFRIPATPQQATTIIGARRPKRQRATAKKPRERIKRAS